MPTSPDWKRNESKNRRSEAEADPDLCSGKRRRKRIPKRPEGARADIFGTCRSRALAGDYRYTFKPISKFILASD